MDFAVQRTNMVESQVRPSDISDRRVPRAMQAVPRERFVQPAAQAIAYMDEALRLAPGRWLLAPRLLAKMIQAAELESDAIVLDIGVASGYSAAVLAHIVETVVAVEQDAGLAASAQKTLVGLGIDNVAIVEGPHAAGMASEGPFDAILVQGSVPAVPATLLDQLKDGGRLIAVVADAPGQGLDWSLGKVVVHRRLGAHFSAATAFDAGTPPLPGFERKTEFTF